VPEIEAGAGLAVSLAVVLVGTTLPSAKLAPMDMDGGFPTLASQTSLSWTDWLHHDADTGEAGPSRLTSMKPERFLRARALTQRSSG
jgi:hypothetical protein